MSCRIGIVLLLLGLYFEPTRAQGQAGTSAATDIGSLGRVRWAAPTFVSTTDLGMPTRAAKEFEKANRLVSMRDWANATERLHRGLAIYPQYAAAYNNLGAIYLQLGNISLAREALRKAIALDDRLAPAFMNLGRLSFRESNFPAAELFLNRAISFAPARNADELCLLANAELHNDHLNQAIETSRMAHRTQIEGHALLHLFAANAFERQRKIVDSIAELQAYLSEEASSPRPDKARCDKAREALVQLQAREAQRAVENNGQP